MIRLNSLKAGLQNFLPGGLRWIESVIPPSAKERILLILTLPVVLATLQPGHAWFKLGIPLRALLPSAKSFSLEPKIYLFECYLLLAITLFFLPAAKNVKKLLAWPLVFKMALALWAFGILRLIFSFPEDLVLAIRNSAFIWYLTLPLVFALARVSARFFEAISALAIAGGLIIFSLTTFKTMLQPGINAIYWMPQVGIYFMFCLKDSHKALRSVLAFILGIAVAISCLSHFQRTTLIGLILIVIFLLPQKIYRKPVVSVLAITLGALIIFYPLLKVKHGQSMRYSSTAQGHPLVKSQSNSQGIEIFRWSMWQDSFDLFLANPFLGIGYEKQVVHRIFKGQGTYVPNDYNWLDGKSPPIAGPHNSYLNALARIGICGALFIILHSFSFFLLWREKYIFSALVVFSQGIYAVFNVGLEGPIRSALMIIVLGLALQLHWRRRLANRRLEIQL